MKFKIYAGLGGGFGGCRLVCIDEFESADEANMRAYEEAWDIYSSHEGCHGLKSWADCAREYAIEEGLVDEDSELEFDLEDIFTDTDINEINEIHREEVESWIEYYAEECGEDEEGEDE